MKTKLFFIFAITATAFYILYKVSSNSNNSFQTVCKLELDQESLSKKGNAITSSTQSLNRYASNMRQLKNVALNFDGNQKKISLQLLDPNNKTQFEIDQIDAHFLLPLLPYKRNDFSSFDLANVVLAEFARNGINFALHAKNDLYADVHYSDKIFNDKGEYFFEDGKYKANPGVQPIRVSVTNNCLRPGLWEISAKDAVGEMYHSWFELPKSFYTKMLSTALKTKPENFAVDFSDPEIFKNVPLELNSLRTLQSKVSSAKVVYNDDKKIGSYSNQDARRKVQRKFYTLKRNDTPLTATKQEDLLDGDIFCMHSFEEPGIYNPNSCTDVSFEKKWATAEVYKVSPKTKYPQQETNQDLSYLELKIFSKDKKEVLLAGNIPSHLLTLKNDFVIPAFGAGVLQSSEHVERRYLRLKEGALPAYAYLARKENEKLLMLNNHLQGYEQIYIRPILKGEETFLRITIVSYERITDLIEFEIPIPELKSEILRSTEAYQPPIYETYTDLNIL